MDIETNQSISLLDEVKLQAQVLLPVLQALRAELGEAHANAIVAQALRAWSRDLQQKIGARTPGSPREKWAAMTAAMSPRIGGDIDVQVLTMEPDTFEFNITGCRYADFFRQLGEPELGALLLCDVDFDVAEVGSPEVQLTRTQTIMQGAPHCHFHYRMQSSTSGK
jgi:hypothetical protein